MPTPSLDGPRAKLDRADEHIARLDGELAAFFDPDAYSVVEHHDPKTGQYRYEVKGADPPTTVATILGDAIHNLHNALDHLAWQLALLTTPKPNHRTQFPIFKDEGLYKDQGRPMIRDLRADLQDRVRDLQPCHRWSPPENDPLWLLYALSIIDKHTVLHTTVVALEEPPDEPFREIRIDPETGERENIYARKDPMSHMEVRFIMATGNTEVEVQSEFPLAIELRDRSAHPLGPRIDQEVVLPSLRAIRSEVATILDGFADVL